MRRQLLKLEALDPTEMELQAVCELFDLGALTELESSARSVQALNDGIISPSLHPTSKCLLRIPTQALVLAERAFFLSYIPGMFQRDFALALF